MRKNKLFIISITILSLMYITAFLADFISPYKYDEHNRECSYQKPLAKGIAFKRIDFFSKGYEYRILFFKSNIHLFGIKNKKEKIFVLGTDKHGRDIFSRLVKAGRVSLSIGIIAVFITFLIGMIIGGVSGYFGGKIDFCIMRMCEMIMCFPMFFLMLALRAVLPLDMPSTQIYFCIIIIFSLIGWPGFARVIRGMVLSISKQPFIESAKIAGIGDFRIIIRHILPNTFSYAIVAAFLNIPSYIIGEAGLSFLGLGIQDPEPSWGNMLSDAMNLRALSDYPWLLIPGFLIFITVILFNTIGDNLRDRFDPKNQ